MFFGFLKLAFNQLELTEKIYMGLISLIFEDCNWQGIEDLFLLFFPLFLCGTNSSRISTKKLLELATNPLDSNQFGEAMEDLDIGYARVSSKEQAEDTNALKQQIQRLKDAGAKIIFSDVQKGSQDNRPQFQALLDLVRQGKVRTLYIVRVERITRSLVTLRKTVDLIVEKGTNLVILDQQLDSTSHQGKLMLNMLGTLAEWEVDLLSERIKNGKAYQRKQRWAYGGRPFGYNVVDHKYVLDHSPYLCLLSDRPENYQELSLENNISDLPGRTVAEVARDCIEIFFQIPVLRRALKAIFEKYGVKKTSANYNGSSKVLHWTQKGFSQWLQNEILDGNLSYNKTYRTKDGKKRDRPREEWEIIYGVHPDQRLYKDGEAEEVRQILKDNTAIGCGLFGKSSNEECRPYAYQTRLVYCAECGSRAIRKTIYRKNGDYSYYGCRHSRTGCENIKNTPCLVIETSLLEALVEKSRILNQDDAETAELQPFQSERLLALQDQLRYLEAYPGYNPDAEALKQNLKRQIGEEQNLFQEERLEERTVEEIIRAGSCREVWEGLSNREKITVYRRVIHKIWIRDGKVESIVFKTGRSLPLLDTQE